MKAKALFVIRYCCNITIVGYRTFKLAEPDIVRKGMTSNLKLSSSSNFEPLAWEP